MVSYADMLVAFNRLLSFAESFDDDELVLEIVSVKSRFIDLYGGV